MSSLGECYSILGLSRPTTQYELEQKYRMLARDMHPDTQGHDPEAIANYQRLVDAYDTIKEDIADGVFEQASTHHTEKQRSTRGPLPKTPAWEVPPPRRQDGGRGRRATECDPWLKKLERGAARYNARIRGAEQELGLPGRGIEQILEMGAADERMLRDRYRSGSTPTTLSDCSSFAHRRAPKSERQKSCVDSIASTVTGLIHQPGTTALLREDSSFAAELGRMIAAEIQKEVQKVVHSTGSTRVSSNRSSDRGYDDIEDDTFSDEVALYSDSDG